MKILNLTGNQITDISPLGQLNNLKELKFGNNQVVDISALESLENLKVLNFGGTPLPEDGNQVEDISVISNLNNLVTLNFYDNKVSDISPLLNNENINQFIEIDMRMNLLDISSDSKSMNVINQLTEIGVEVLYEPQK